MSAVVGAVSVPLSFPVTIDGVLCKQLLMRRPKVRDLKLARQQAGGDGDSAAIEVFAFANVASVTPDVIEDLDLADYLRLQEVWQGFLGESLAKAS